MEIGINIDLFGLEVETGWSIDDVRWGESYTDREAVERFRSEDVHIVPVT